MYEDLFPARLAELRSQKKVSARDMSLSIGQTPGYMNNIETVKALPSMAGFFYLCEFLGVTPQEFFDMGSRQPAKLRPFVEKVKKLSRTQFASILSIVNNAMDKIFTEGVLDMIKNKRNVCFRELGRKKTALFVLNSPMNKSLLSLANMMYSDLFKELFEEAEEKLEGRLDVPVHIVCDDFAYAGKIDGFDNYITSSGRQASA